MLSDYGYRTGKPDEEATRTNGTSVPEAGRRGDTHERDILSVFYAPDIRLLFYGTVTL